MLHIGGMQAFKLEKLVIFKALSSNEKALEKTFQDTVFIENFTMINLGFLYLYEKMTIK